MLSSIASTQRCALHHSPLRTQLIHRCHQSKACVHRDVTLPSQRPIELCVIVDENNNVVRAEPRNVTVSKRLLGRGSYILVFNKEKHLFISKRTTAKDVYPGYLDVVISGVVHYGEEYEDTAARELAEELGLTADVAKQSLSRLCVFPYKDDVCHVWGCAFTCQYDGDIKLQEEEVEWGQFMPLKEVVALMQKEKFTPVGKHVLELFLSSAGVPCTTSGT